MNSSITETLQLIWLLNNVLLVYSSSARIESKSASRHFVEESQVKDTRYSNEHDLRQNVTRIHQKESNMVDGLPLLASDIEKGRELFDVDHLYRIPPPQRFDCDDSKSFVFRFEVSVS